ncbi:MAG: PEP-CTERM sorting domain-containing protein [Terriglobia bacterium]
MKKSVISVAIVLGFLVLFVSVASFADDVTLTLIPASGDVSGSLGSTVGWGYTLTTNTSNWLETLSVSAGSFIDGPPNLIFDFPNVGPNSSLTEDFPLVSTASCSSPPCGLYEFTWNSNAPSGDVNSGMFTVSSEYFSGDAANPASNDLGPAPDASASYSVSVSSSTTVTPEPSTVLLLLTGLCGLGLWHRRWLSGLGFVGD